MAAASERARDFRQVWQGAMAVEQATRLLTAWPRWRALRHSPVQASSSSSDSIESRSQRGFLQDVRCLHYLRYKRNGFYCEIGVDDAAHDSNTALLADAAYGWSGILVDPNIFNVADRQNCSVSRVALAGQCGTASFSVGGPFSGLTEFATSPTHNKKWAEHCSSLPTTIVETRTPLEVLREANAPPVIDYLSLDVEGAEMEILRHWPFDEYIVRIATIETNNDRAKEDELRAFMASKGYTFLGHAAVDDYFGHSATLEMEGGEIQPPLDYLKASSHARFMFHKPERPAQPRNRQQPCSSEEPPPIPPEFAAAAAAMPSPLRKLLVENAPIAAELSAAAIEACLEFVPLGLPPGRSTDAMTHQRLLDPPTCAALRDAVESRHDHERDTVDGAEDIQLNLSCDELEAIIGSVRINAIVEAARALDVRRGGSGKRELPIVEAFVRRYTPSIRPWHPFHQDRAAVTVNVALCDDGEHGGGKLLGLFDDGVVHFERGAGDATVHLSRIVHGVSRMTSGVRFALIVFLGHEPPVRRTLGPDGSWTREVVEP